MRERVGISGLVLVLAPVFACIALAIAHPTGDPQASKSLILRLLDFQATYWLRQGMFVPPPLLAVGTVVSFYEWRQHRSAIAGLALAFGLAFLGIWAIVAVIPYLLFVN